MDQRSKEILLAPESKKIVRINALKNMMYTVLLIPIGIFCLMNLYKSDHLFYFIDGVFYFNRSYIAILIICSYFVPFFIALIVVVGGLRFFQLSYSWDHLKPWLRGVYGTSIVLIGLLLFMSIGATLAIYYAHLKGI